MAIDEEYTEESFRKQIYDKGGASFRNMPCPVHGHYQSSISIAGWGCISVACCTEQIRWMESEAKRLGLSERLEELKAQAEARRVKVEVEDRQQVEATKSLFATEIIGAKVVGCENPDRSGFENIIVETLSGVRYKIIGEEGVGLEKI